MATGSSTTGESDASRVKHSIDFAVGKTLPYAVPLRVAKLFF